MQKFLLVLIGLSYAFTLRAQTGSNQRTALSFGAELNIPQRSGYTIGYGASAKFELPLANALSFTATAGVHQYHLKTLYNCPGGNNTFVPLKAGVKYYIDPRFYAEGEVGSVIDHNRESDQNKFAYSLGTGFLLPLKNTSNMIDAGLRYEEWSKNGLQQFGIRVAYRFGL
jgi:hypothetical protein